MKNITFCSKEARKEAERIKQAEKEAKIHDPVDGHFSSLQYELFTMEDNLITAQQERDYWMNKVNELTQAIKQVKSEILQEKN